MSNPSFSDFEELTPWILFNRVRSLTVLGFTSNGEVTRMLFFPICDCLGLVSGKSPASCYATWKTALEHLRGKSSAPTVRYICFTHVGAKATPCLEFEGILDLLRSERERSANKSALAAESGNLPLGPSPPPPAEESASVAPPHTHRQPANERSRSSPDYHSLPRRASVPAVGGGPFRGG
jgi:hypothetical protein